MYNFSKIVKTYNKNTKETTITNVVSTGPQGIQGERGDIGPQGRIGNTGPIGPRGVTGPEGPTLPNAEFHSDYIYWNGNTKTPGWEIGSTRVNLGKRAGYAIPGKETVCVGNNSGFNNQGNYSVSIGSNSAYVNQGDYSVAIGDEAAKNEQGNNSIAIGTKSGKFKQGNNCIAVGANCCTEGEGMNSIVIGANSSAKKAQMATIVGYNSKSNGDSEKNGIIIGSNNIINENSTIIGDEINDEGVSGCYISRINQQDISPYLNKILVATDRQQILCGQIPIKNKNIITGFNNSEPIIEEINYKTFVIEHPKNKNKYLVHGCLEGPEAGIYYRGKGEIINNENVMISLPDYVAGWGSEFIVTVTAIFNGKINKFAVSDVNETGQFYVYGKNGRFNWIVVGKRASITIEPFKNEINIKGDGPYRYVS